jgi:hypothetical protein
MGFKDIEKSTFFGNERIILLKLVRTLNIRDREGKLYFPEVLFSIYFNLCGVSNSTVMRNTLMKENYTNILLKYPKL